MAEVVFGKVRQQFGLKYEDLQAGSYFINEEGTVYVAVYKKGNMGNTSNPTIALLSKPSITHEGTLPIGNFRLLQPGETFTVTI